MATKRQASLTFCTPPAIQSLGLAFLFACALNAQTGDSANRYIFGGPSIVNTSLDRVWVLEGGGGGFGLSSENKRIKYNMGYGGFMFGYLWGGTQKP